MKDSRAVSDDISLSSQVLGAVYKKPLDSRKSLTPSHLGEMEQYYQY